MRKTVALADLLSAVEAAQLAGITESHLRVLIVRDQFPAPIRRDPQLWHRRDVENWRKARKKP